MVPEKYGKYAKQLGPPTRVAMQFAPIGRPSPEILGPVVGGFEIGCGALVLLGLCTRFAVLPLLAIMAVAIWKTKLPLLATGGVWKMAHDGRTDFCMTLGALFLLCAGGGAWSIDALRKHRRTTTLSPPAYDHDA